MLISTGKVNGALELADGCAHKWTLRRTRRCLQLVLPSQDLCGALADDDTGSHRVARCHARHDGPIRNTKIFDSIDFKLAVNHRHIVLAYLFGTGLMPVGH